MNNFSHVASVETVADRREAFEREQLHRATERERLLVALKSSRHEAKHRIRLWEQVFGIHLPRAADHKLVHVIATQTALSEHDVRLEQTRRRNELIPLATPVHGG